MSNDKYTVKRTERTWMSKKEYLICKGNKEVLKLKNLDEANEVCKYLNKITKSKSTVRKVSKKTTSKSAKKEEEKE